MGELQYKCEKKFLILVYTQDGSTIYPRVLYIVEGPRHALIAVQACARERVERRTRQSARRHQPRAALLRTF